MSKKRGSDSKYFLKKIKNSLAGIALGAGLALGTAALTATGAEAKEAKCVPHYLQGLRSPEDKLENMFEKDRVYDTLKTKYPYKYSGTIINGSIEVQAKIHGVDATLVFPNYVRSGDKVMHYHAMGIDTYSKREFQCVVDDNIEYIKNAAELAIKDYRDTLPAILNAQEKMLRKEGALKEGQHLKDIIDENIEDFEGYEDYKGSGLKIRDVLFTPDTNIKDFPPTRYYFDEIPALGVAYINTGMIAIDPKARILDYINGWPTIMVHEMTHRNPKLQSSPMLNKFDAELWASFPMLVHDDMLHFLWHGYLADVRKVAKTLFNFDSKLAWQDITSLDTIMGTEFEKDKKHKKLRDYIGRVELVSKAIRDTAFNRYIPEFYTHPLYFMTLNDLMNDDNATFKLIMYTTHEPTLLGGPEKTRDFIQQNKDVIEESFKTVMRKLKEQRDDNSFTEEQKERIRAEIERRLNKMSPEERRMLRETAERFGMPKTEKPEDLIEFGLKMHRLGIGNINIETEEPVIVP